MGIRPESLKIVKENSSVENCIEGKVDIIEMAGGAESFVHLIVGYEKIIAKIDSKEEPKKKVIL